MAAEFVNDLKKAVNVNDALIHYHAGAGLAEEAATERGSAQKDKVMTEYLHADSLSYDEHQQKRVSWLLNAIQPSDNGEQRTVTGRTAWAGEVWWAYLSVYLHQVTLGTLWWTLDSC